MKYTESASHPAMCHQKIMSAALITEPTQACVVEIPAPQPGPGEVRVKVEGCGVCASNLPVWQGRPWFKYPLEPGALGHEGWGTIDSVGSQVADLQVGDRVTMLSYHAYAEYDVASVEAVVKLPDALAGRPFPGEPLGCAINVFRRSDVQAGQTVAVVGVGFLGALLVQLCARAGARVIGIDRRASALEIARTMGAVDTLRLDNPAEAVEKVRQLTKGNFCPRVIEATGKQAPLDLATELTAVRGKLIVAGYHQDGLRQVNVQLWNWRGIDVINAHERDPNVYLDVIRAAVREVAEGRFDPEPLYSHTFSINRLADALAALEQRPAGFMKALITF